MQYLWKLLFKHFKTFGMSYIIKEKDGKKIIQGSYIPEGYTCQCKSMAYTVEVPKCATDEQIQGIVKLIEGRK